MGIAIKPALGARVERGASPTCQQAQWLARRHRGEAEAMAQTRGFFAKQKTGAEGSTWRLCGRGETGAQPGGFIAHTAARGMIIDQPHGLHESKSGGGAKKLPAAVFKVFC